MENELTDTESPVKRRKLNNNQYEKVSLNENVNKNKKKTQKIPNDDEQNKKNPNKNTRDVINVTDEKDQNDVKNANNMENKNSTNNTTNTNEANDANDLKDANDSNDTNDTNNKKKSVTKTKNKKIHSKHNTNFRYVKGLKIYNSEACKLRVLILSKSINKTYNDAIPSKLVVMDGHGDKIIVNVWKDQLRKIRKVQVGKKYQLSFPKIVRNKNVAYQQYNPNTLAVGYRTVFTPLIAGALGENELTTDKIYQFERSLLIAKNKSVGEKVDAIGIIRNVGEITDQKNSFRRTINIYDKTGTSTVTLFGVSVYNDFKIGSVIAFSQGIVTDYEGRGFSNPGFYEIDPDYAECKTIKQFANNMSIEDQKLQFKADETQFINEVSKTIEDVIDIIEEFEETKEHQEQTIVICDAVISDVDIQEKKITITLMDINDSTKCLDTSAWDSICKTLFNGKDVQQMYSMKVNKPSYYSNVVQKCLNECEHKELKFMIRSSVNKYQGKYSIQFRFTKIVKSADEDSSSANKGIDSSNVVHSIENGAKSLSIDPQNQNIQKLQMDVDE